MYKDRVHLLLYSPFLLVEDKRLNWLGFGLIVNCKLSSGSPSYLLLLLRTCFCWSTLKLFMNCAM